MAIESKNSYIPTLDGLRAIAIGGVILSHATPREGHPIIVKIGHFGVLVFFALSGYLITSRLLDEYDQAGSISLRNFYLRRVFRILPPALFYLAAVFVLDWTGVIECTWRGIRSALFLYTNYANLGEAEWHVRHFWSLSVEEHFYLFWPALLIAFGVRRGWRTAGVLIVAISAWRALDDQHNFAARLFHDPSLIQNSFRTDLIADVLLWGCCLAYLLRPRAERKLHPALSTAVAVAAAALMFVFFLYNVPHVSVFRYVLPSVLLGALVSAPDAPIGRLLELAPIRFIGRLSYSLYIWQQLFLGGIGRHLPTPLALVATVVCALISYWMVEQPMIRFGRKLLKRKPAPIAPQIDLLPEGSPASNSL